MKRSTFGILAALAIFVGIGMTPMFAPRDIEKTPWGNFPGSPAWYAPVYEFDNEQGIDPFTTTALSSGTGAVTTDENLGVYTLSGAATTDNSGFQLQGDMETVSLNLGKKVLFMERLKGSDATESEYFAGLSITDTTMLSGTGTLAIASVTMSDAIGFYKPDGQATYYGVIIRDSVLTSVGPFATSMADDTYLRLSFEIQMDGTTAGKGTVNFYMNNVQVGQLTSTTMPYDTEEILTPATAFVTGNNTGTKTAKVDYIGVAVER